MTLGKHGQEIVVPEVSRADRDLTADTTLLNGKEGNSTSSPETQQPNIVTDSGHVGEASANAVPEVANVSSTQVIVKNTKKSKEKANWFKRNVLALSLGAFALSVTAGVVFEPLDHTKAELGHAAPWAAGGILATEAMWLAGAGLMGVGAGRRMNKNPLKWHSQSARSHSRQSIVQYLLLFAI